MAESVLTRVLRGSSDANLRFGDLRGLLLQIGFRERTRGSHHIFTRQDVDEIVNIQARNGMAKPYQVKQVRAVLVRYKLTEGTAD
jgi:hypothetical protein